MLKLLMVILYSEGGCFAYLNNNFIYKNQGKKNVKHELRRGFQ